MLNDLADCPESMILLGGRPGTGKTRLCLELMNFFQKRGEKILLYSLEHYEKPQLFERETNIFDIVDDIKGTMSLKAVFIDYFQLLNLKGNETEKGLKLLKKTACEQSVTVYMFFMLNRHFDSERPEKSMFSFNNLNVSKFFNVVGFLDHGVKENDVWKFKRIV